MLSVSGVIVTTTCRYIAAQNNIGTWKHSGMWSFESKWILRCSSLKAPLCFISCAGLIVCCQLILGLDHCVLLGLENGSQQFIGLYIYLLQLPHHLFEELAMDVYDEVDRRENDSSELTISIFNLIVLIHEPYLINQWCIVHAML